MSRTMTYIFSLTFSITLRKKSHLINTLFFTLGGETQTNGTRRFISSSFQSPSDIVTNFLNFPNNTLPNPYCTKMSLSVFSKTKIISPIEELHFKLCACHGHLEQITRFKYSLGREYFRRLQLSS